MVWSTTENPTVDSYGGITNDGTGTNSYVSEMVELSPGITYYVRAYATNDIGTAYGHQRSFKTLGQVPTVSTSPASGITNTKAILVGFVNANHLETTVVFEYGPTTEYGSTITATQSPVTGSSNTNVSAAIDGLTLGATYYYRVKAENLRYLPEVVGPNTGSKTEPFYYVYGYDGTDVNAAKATDNYQDYGVLYNWTAALNACPTGWHLPSDAEWQQLIDFVVSQGYPIDWRNPNGAGNALKSCRQVDSPLGGDCNTSDHPRWNSDGTHYGTDAFGFSALPGGFRSTFGSFLHVGNNGLWWSASERSSANAWNRFMDYRSGSVIRDNYNDKAFGVSLRCVRDFD